MGLDDPALGRLLRQHQARAIVHSERSVGVVGHVRRDRPTVRADEREHARQIALALHDLDPAESVEESVRVEHVGAEVDLVRGQLLRGEALGVLRLDDALHVARRVAHDAPVARGIDLVRGEQGRAGPVLLVLCEQPLELLGGDQGVIAGQHQDRTRLHRVARGQDGGTRALPLTLLGHLDAVGKALGNAVARPNHRDHPLGAGRPRGIGDPLHERLAGNPMKNLRSIRKHASALAGGHDEDRERRGHGLMRVPGGGVEPYPQDSPDGEWCNWQHGALWMPKRRFKTSLPSLFDVRPGCEHVFVRCPAELPSISERELHWLAGLLEGEGSFLAAPPSRPRSPCVQVLMVDRDIIERAGGLFGTGVYMIPPRREGWSTTYSARIRGTRAVLWMHRLRPLMGERRRAPNRPSPRKLMRRIPGGFLTTSEQRRRSPGSRTANRSARLPSGSAQASGASTTSGWVARTRISPVRRPPSGPCAGSARGLLRCPFRGLGLLGGLCRALALPSAPVRGVRGRLWRRRRAL